VGNLKPSRVPEGPRGIDKFVARGSRALERARASVRRSSRIHNEKSWLGSAAAGRGCRKPNLSGSVIWTGDWRHAAMGKSSSRDLNRNPGPLAIRADCFWVPGAGTRATPRFSRIWDAEQKSVVCAVLDNEIVQAFSMTEPQGFGADQVFKTKARSRSRRRRCNPRPRDYYSPAQIVR